MWVACVVDFSGAAQYGDRQEPGSAAARCASVEVSITRNVRQGVDQLITALGFRDYTA